MEVILVSVYTDLKKLFDVNDIQSKFWSYISLCTDSKRSFKSFGSYISLCIYRLAKIIWCECIYKVSFEVILGSVQTFQNHLTWMYIQSKFWSYVLVSVQTFKDHLMWMYIQSKFWSYIRLCTDFPKSFDVNVYTK